MRKFDSLVLVFLFCLFERPALAQDVVNFSQGMTLYDSRANHRKDLVIQILEHTKSDFGDYELNLIYPPMTFQRSLAEIVEGKKLNAHIAVHRADWHDNAVVIPVPVMRGLMSYRLLMVSESNASKFAQLRSVDELKKWRAGTLKHWSLTKVLKENGFPVVEAQDYETLFKMLSTNRFDYLLRGVNEVYSELESKDLVPTNVVVAPDIAVFIPLPQFLIISRKHPHLAKRMRVGMQRVVESGVLNQLNMKYHSENIHKASLSDRTILSIPNSDMSEQQLGDESLWLHYDKE